MDSTEIKDFAVKNWKYVLAAALIVLAAVGGRLTAPEPQAKIQIQEKIVEKTVSVVDEKLVEQEVQKRVHDIEVKMARHTVKETVKTPDGTTTTRETTDVKVDTREKEVVVQYVDKIVEKQVVQYVDRAVETKVLIEPAKKQWLVGLTADLGLEKQPTTLVPSMTLFVGVQANRRIAGPFFVGAKAGVGIDPVLGSFRGGIVGVFAGIEF